MSDIDSLINIWSMRPPPESCCGQAWEQGARQGWQWAADEIEELRERLHYSHGTWELCRKHRDEAERKVERLQAAADTAQKILSAWLAHQYSNHEQYVKLHKARDALRCALEEK